MPLRAAMLLAASCLIYQLLIPPVTGIADNGDFARLMHPFGLEHVPDDYNARYFDYVDVNYHFTEPPRLAKVLTAVPSSELIPIAAAVLLNHFTSKTGDFDIRLMGIVHGCALLALLAWLWPLLPQRPRSRSWVVGLVALLVLLDGAYVSYLNTFYAEPAVYLSLLGLCGACLRAIQSREMTKRDVALLICFALLLVTAKAQMNAAAILVAPLAALFIIRYYAGARTRALAVVTALLLLATGAVAYWRYPDQLKRANLYVHVFYSILGSSPDKEADLVALGLEPGLVKYFGANVWSSEIDLYDPQLTEHFFRRISYAAIVRFYATHPSRLQSVVNAGVVSFFHVNEESRLGQLEHQPRVAPRQLNKALRIWSNLRAAAGAYPWTSVAIFTILIAATIALTPHWPLRALELFLLLLAASQFLTSILGEGDAGLAKHLFVCVLAGDLLCFCALIRLTSRPQRTAKPQPC